MNIVEGRSDIVRDPNTRAIINVDKEAHDTAVAASSARQKAKEQLKSNTKDINIIRDELTEIKGMMKTLVTKLSDNGR